MFNLNPHERKKALFLDRDGVINVDKGYVHKTNNFELMPGVVSGLRQFQDAGYMLIVVTNQSGIARGYYSEHDFQRLTEHMLRMLVARGVNVSRVYYCPHQRDAATHEYRRLCNCRKPAPGMIQQAIREWVIDPALSILVGDSLSDILAGRAAGIRYCYLLSADALLDERQAVRPDAVYASLSEMAAKLLGKN